MDFNEFLTKLTLTHPTKGKQPFTPNPYTEKHIKLLEENKHTILLKSRQLGTSTLLAAFALWRILHHSNKIMAYSIRHRFVQLVTELYLSLPEIEKPGVSEKNNTLLKFSPESFITCNCSDFEDTLPDMVIADEAAFLPSSQDWTEFVHDADIETHIASTPKENTLFHMLWKDSNTPYKQLEYVYEDAVQDKWYEYLEGKTDHIKSMGIQTWLSEFGGVFNSVNEKTEVVNTRLTSQEKDYLQKKADKLNFRSLSDYIRFIMFNKE